MSQSSLDLKALYRACDPDQALDPSDTRNVDLDAWHAKSPPVRGAEWVARLARDFELADSAILRLFSGLPGAGKSTELRRLAARLAQDPGPNLLPVLIDTEELLDLRTSIENADLLLVMFHETERAVLRLEGIDPDRSSSGGVFARFTRLLRRTQVEPSKAEIGIGATPGNTAKLTFDLKEDPDLREQVRRIMRENRALFAREVHQAFTDLQNRVITKGRAGLVLLVDSLEKLRGMSDNFETVLKSAEQLFAGGAPHLQLPVHTLYTIPPALVLRLSDDIKLLPMIKLRSQDGEPFQEGFEAARQIIRQRVNDQQLAAIFGSTEAESRVRELIAASGGYPREIVRLLRACLTVRTFPIAEHELQIILQEAGGAYRRVAEGQGYPALEVLARVHVTKRLVVNKEERELVDHLLAHNLILRYQNANDWVDIHPALLRIESIQENAKRLRREMIAPVEETSHRAGSS